VAVLLSLGLTLLAGLSQAGCGLDFGFDDAWDDCCYDCRTVCDGTSGEVQNSCLASCSLCQGASECFARLEGRFEGMRHTPEEWQPVDCSLLR
jgi:hypothetical protein